MNVLFWSTGKDSTATGILAKLNRIQIDRIICCLPDLFKMELELKEKFEEFMGVKVELIEGPTFEDYFYRKKIKGKYVGTIYGFPMTLNKTCARVLKWEPMKKHLEGIGEFTGFIGIAKNERRSPPSKNNRSLLIEYGYTEDDARKLCEEYGLLNPLYKLFKRTGCVRCPKQSLKALWIMKHIEPEKYQWCMDHDDESPVKFKPNRNFKEIDAHIKKKFGGDHYGR